MSQIKTTGLIIKLCNLNDNDRIFTVLTKDYGKISVIGKGVRSQKHKCFSAMQLFCLSDFVFEKTTGMYYPVSASVKENFFNIRNSVEKVSLATYITDIVNAIPDEFPIEDDYFRFILNSLYLISKIDVSSGDYIENILKYKCVFELKTVCENGYSPLCSKCGVCNSTKNIKYFDVTQGASVCDTCGEKNSNSILYQIDNNLHRIIYQITNSDLRSVFSLDFKGVNMYNLSKITEEYLLSQMEIGLSSLEYLKSILNSK